MYVLQLMKNNVGEYFRLLRVLFEREGNGHFLVVWDGWFLLFINWDDG